MRDPANHGATVAHPERTRLPLTLAALTFAGTVNLARAANGRELSEASWISIMNVVYPWEFFAAIAVLLGILIVLTINIIYRRRAELALRYNQQRLASINQCLLTLGDNFNKNVERLTALCGELLGAQYTFYNRMESGRFVQIGRWSAAEDLPFACQGPECGLCFDVLQYSEDTIQVIHELDRSPYAIANPNFERFGLRTAMIQPIKWGELSSGCLCAFFLQKITPSEEDQRLMGIIAAALANEEERHRADQALRESRERYRNVYNIAPLAFVVWDREYCITDWNQAAEEVFGWKREEVLGRNFQEFLIPMEHRRHIQNIGQELLAGQAHARTEIENLTKSGHRVVCEWNFSTRHDHQGRVTGGISLVLDVTLRNQAEESIRQSEARFRELFDQAPVGYHELDMDGRILRINRTECEMLGYSEHQMLGRPVWEFVAPQEREAARLRVSGKLAGRIPVDHPVECGFLCSDNSVKIMLIEDLILFGEDGRIRGIRSTLQDITERKQTEQALRENETKYRTIFELSPHPIVMLDRQGYLLTINSRLSEWLEIKPEQVQGKHLREFKVLDEADRQKALSMLHQRMAGENPPPYELTIRTPDGNDRICTITASPMYDDEGNIFADLAMIVDVTEQKQIEHDLRRLVTAMDQAAETIMITDTEGTIQYVNPAFVRTTGYSRVEAIGQKFTICRSNRHDQAFYDQIWSTIRSGQIWSGRMTNKKKDGTLFEEETTISPVRDHEGQIINFVAVKRDISGVLRLENQLRQAQKMEAIGQLAGGIAHDFNNLLQAIQGYAELARHQLEADHPSRHNLEEVDRAANRAGSLIRQLLTFSRREALMPEHVSLNELISGLVKMLRRLIGEDIELLLVSGENLGPIYGDPGQIEQILMNLCVNARDAMPEGGRITIETAPVRLDQAYCKSHPWAREGNFVALTVSDTGEGMKPEIRDRIFEPFFSTKEVGKGTGLGLATVYGIVKQHEGLISVYSEPGEGTTFRIYLPAAGGEVEDDHEQVEAPPPPSGGHETILLAEDEELVRNLSLEVLESAGYNVVVARDGLEAQEKFEQHAERIHLALLDVVMPKKSGRAIGNLIRQRCPELPVLFTSGYSQNHLDTSFDDDAHTRLILKPFGPNELLRRVREMIQNGHEPD